MIKAYRIRQVRPAGLILGTSRAEVALDPDHPKWAQSARSVYNAAFADANPYEMRRMLEHALACSEIQQVVVGLDFYTFNIFFENRPDFSDRRLAVGADGRWRAFPLDEWIATLFSWDALAKSWQVLRAQSRGEPRFLLSNGRQNPEPRRALRMTSAHERFLLTEYEYAWYKWRQGPDHSFALYHPATGASYFDELDRLMTVARQHGVDIRLFVSPEHARLTLLKAEAGLWPAYEQWLGEVASRAERAGVPVWDFACFNEFTTEPVPFLMQPESSMRFYRDASHYSPLTGDRVLDVVLGDPLAKECDGDVFRISRENLSAYLVELRSRRDAYAQDHPKDVEELRRILRFNEESDITRAVRNVQHRLAAIQDE